MYDPAPTALVTDTPSIAHFHKPSSSVSSSVSSANPIKRSASLSSSPGFATRPSTAPYRPPTPNDPPAANGKLVKKRGHSRRSSSVNVPNDAIGTTPQDLGNKRSSQSPVAKSPLEKGGRIGFARRLSLGGSLFTAGDGQTSPNSPRKGSGLRSKTPDKSPKLRSPAPLTPRLEQLPPIESTPALPTQLLPSDSTIATAGSSGSGFPSNSSSNTDYFSAKSHKAGSANASRTKLSRSETPQSLYTTATSPTESSPRRMTGAATGGSNRPRRKASHSRNQSDSSTYSETDRSRSKGRDKDKKTMLSRALAKANTAVVLDNAQNVEGAIEAYLDACKLLQAVLLKSSGEEDRRKLDAIRQTYTNRIDELRDVSGEVPTNDDKSDEKSLPARPMSDDSMATVSQSLYNDDTLDDDEPVTIQTATVTRIVNDRSIDAKLNESQEDVETPKVDTPQKQRASVLSTAIRDIEFNFQNSGVDSSFLQSPEAARGDRLFNRSISYESPMERSYMPPPLSPMRRAPSPQTALEIPPSEQLLRPPDSISNEHSRESSNGSVSWLDTISEAGGSSCSESIHSVRSVRLDNGFKGTHLRMDSGDTDNDFDAAMDAAVDAAYEDGLDLLEDTDESRKRNTIIDARLKIDLAKQKVREAEREEAEMRAAALRDRQTLDQPFVWDMSELSSPGDDAADEEERILDEMTREYMLDGFDFGLQSKSALPRGSDSSGYSGATWNSSMSSTRGTAATVLSPVTEDGDQVLQLVSSRFVRPPIPATPAPPPPEKDPPAEAKKDLQSKALPKAPTSPSQTQSVINRRFSGQSGKQLKIDTSSSPSRVRKNETRESPTQPTPRSATSSKFDMSLKDLAGRVSDGRRPSLGSLYAFGRRPTPSPSEVSASNPILTQINGENGRTPQSPVGSRAPGKLGPPPAILKKNKSSLSLTSRTLSVSSPNGSDGSLHTPMSASFSHSSQKGLLNGAIPPSVQIVPTDALPINGRRLFDNDIHSSDHPGKPSSTHPEAPLPLEPCPDSYLLRPFWLMRCLFQTIAHPRGAYITNKLFVPKDVWWVKNVKIKNVDDKISNCDLLSAALLKLGTVDTLDADAVLEEMQSLENVLDQVQLNLTKKLGNEVGAQSVSNLFKDAANQNNVDSSLPQPPKSAGAKSTSYLTSWRKLRSKNSGTQLSAMYAVSQDLPKDALMMSSLPMTSLPNIRLAKRDVGRVECSGPNGNYMSALARLFDAVQVVDQIARQVEDPGLKHSSSTHIGLELCTRHASEFFGFYICRFVLQDVTMLLDKYIKRSSEWVVL